MQQNIKNNNVKSLDLLLTNDNYYDFMLYKGEVIDRELSGISTDNLAAYIDINDPSCINYYGDLVSKKTWEKAVNEGVKLEDIGYTAVDNGLITYKKDEITNEIFYNLFFNSVLIIDESDKKLRLHKVEGNQQIYDFRSSVEQNNTDGKYLSLRGGFYQGFYKLYGFDYEVLPNYIESDMHADITLRRRKDYQELPNTLNKTHEANEGFFFYLGARAENKFTEIYNGTYHPEFSGSVIETNFIDDDPNDPFFEDETPFIEEPCCDDYLNQNDISLSGITIITTDDHPENERGYFEFETDNKFILFNRTKTGLTINNCSGITSVLLTGTTTGRYKENPFVLFNRTATGLTTATAEKYLEENKDAYNPEESVYNNAFGLRITKDGAIGYRYLIKDCENEKGYSILEEYSNNNVVKENEWANINVRFEILNNTGYDSCNRPLNLGKRLLRIKIYVNGYLVFVSKPLPEFNFRELDDVATKQEGVPYNISLGGGTLGLAERVWTDYYNLPTEHYLLDDYFAGSFIGDIKSFKLYTSAQDLQTIRNNSKNELF